MVNKKILFDCIVECSVSISVVVSPAAMSLPLQSADAQQNNGSTSNNTTNNNSSSNTTLGQNIHQPDSLPEAAVIVINKDDTSDRVVFEPNNVTIRAGEEILIINNDASPQSFTSGDGPNDPMAGTAFDTGLIQPGQFIEYTAANVQDGQQLSFFSRADPSATGTLIISGVIPEFGQLSAIVLAAAIIVTVVIMRTATGSGRPFKR